jgi:hypothetical protein
VHKKFQPRKDSVNMADDQSQSPTGGECRDDATIDFNASCHRDLSVPSYYLSSQQQQHQQQQQEMDEVVSSSSSRRDTSLRTFGTISKDMIRTFQTTVQGNTRSERMISSDNNSRLASSLTSITNTTSIIIQPRLHKLASEGSSRIVQSVQQIVGDRGIYSSHVRSWGSNVSAEISSFTSHKVVPLFRRHTTCPSSSEFEQHGNYRWADGISSMGGGVSSGSSKKDVSFDYQLMKDNE